MRAMMHAHVWQDTFTEWHDAMCTSFVTARVEAEEGGGGEEEK